MKYVIVTTPDEQAKGIAAAGLVFIVLTGIGIATEYVTENWAWIAPVAGTALFLIAAIAANLFLPNFFKTAILLLFFIAVTYGIGIGASAISNVYSGRFVSFHHYYVDMYAQSLGQIFARAAVYAGAVFVFCLTPWARRKRSVWKTILLANSLLIGVPAIMIVAGGLIRVAQG